MMDLSDEEFLHIANKKFTKVCLISKIDNKITLSVETKDAQLT